MLHSPPNVKFLIVDQHGLQNNASILSPHFLYAISLTKGNSFSKYSYQLPSQESNGVSIVAFSDMQRFEECQENVLLSLAQQRLMQETVVIELKYILILLQLWSG